MGPVTPVDHIDVVDGNGELTPMNATGFADIDGEPSADEDRRARPEIKKSNAVVVERRLDPPVAVGRVSRGRTRQTTIIPPSPEIQIGRSTIWATRAKKCIGDLRLQEAAVADGWAKC